MIKQREFDGVDLDELAALVEAESYLIGDVDEDVVSLTRRLLELEAQEREVSALRQSLHRRLDSFPNATTEAREREVSAERKELHARIDLVLRELAAVGWRSHTGYRALSPARSTRE